MKPAILLIRSLTRQCSHSSDLLISASQLALISKDLQIHLREEICTHGSPPTWPWSAREAQAAEAAQERARYCVVRSRTERAGYLQAAISVWQGIEERESLSLQAPKWPLFADTIESVGPVAGTANGSPPAHFTQGYGVVWASDLQCCPLTIPLMVAGL